MLQLLSPLHMMSGTGFGESPQGPSSMKPCLQLLVSLFIFANFAGAGCSTAADKAPPQPRMDLNLPDVDLTIPVWIDKHGAPPFPVREFLEKRARTSADGERLYLEALAEVDQYLNVIYPEREQVTRLAQCKTLVDEITAVHAMDQPPLERLTKVVAATDRLRDLVDAAQQHANVSLRCRLSFADNFPYVLSVRTCGRLAALELRLSHEAGSFSDADRTLSRTFRMARDLHPGGSIIQQLVATSVVEGILFASLEKFVLTRADLSVANCDRLIAVLREHETDGTDVLSEGAQAEYVILGNTLDGLQAGKLNGIEVEESLSSALVKKISFDAEWMELNRIYTIVFQYCKTPYHVTLAGNEPTVQLHALRSKLGAKTEAENDFAAALRRGAFLVLLLPDYPKVRAAIVRHATRVRAFQAVVAVRRYQLRHGAWPLTLAAALTEANIPPDLLDPYSGKAFRYRILGGSPLVYSIASDGKDDGGEKDWKFGEQPGDFLFPIPALFAKAE